MTQCHKIHPNITIIIDLISVISDDPVRLMIIKQRSM